MNNNPNKRQIVSLEELIPQHDCLKLLILHTPYTLHIDTLHLCCNLVKLDLSNNGLESFPFLGDIFSLRFMFIHDNKLNAAAFRNIFEKGSQYGQSLLAKNIVWVTFWGNKECFIARHYIANNTNAIACDKHIIMPEQRKPTPNLEIQSFTEKSDITYLLRGSQTKKNATEDQYMAQLWKQLALLRKQYVNIYSIIKIQKVFRGWRVRTKLRVKKQQVFEFRKIVGVYFEAWKIHNNRSKKMLSILKAKKRQHLLLPLKQMKQKHIEVRLKELAKEARARLILKRTGFIRQYKLFYTLRGNFKRLQTLYRLLNISSSTCVYIHRHQLQLFEELIIPFAGRFTKKNQSKLKIKQNTQINLRYFSQYNSLNNIQFLSIFQQNVKSTAYYCHYIQQNIKSRQTKLLRNSQLKSIYKNIHFTTRQQMKMQQINYNFNYKQQFELNELVKIEASERELKDMVRGVFFYNNGYLLGSVPGNRAHILSEFILKQSSAAITIQRNWRGYKFRKTNLKNIKQFMKVQRATITLQRWCRRLPQVHRKSFIYESSKILNKIDNPSFMIDLKEYFTVITQYAQPNMKFMEHYLCIYLNRIKDELVVSWDQQENKKQSIFINKKINKTPFGMKFLSDKVGITQQEIINRTTYKELYEKCDIAFLFHHQSNSSIINKGNNQLLCLDFKNKAEARFRALVLLTLTYSFPQKNIIKIYQVEKNIVKKVIMDGSMNFVSNQNYSALRHIEKKLKQKQNTNLSVIDSKIYLSTDSSVIKQKLVKSQQRLFIFMANYPTPQRKEFIEEVKPKEIKRYNTAILNQPLFDEAQIEVREVRISNIQQEKKSNFKVVVRKRSVKQFRAEKRLKKKQAPNFMLDSVSMNERLTTQPDLATYKTEKSDVKIQHRSLQKQEENQKLANHRSKMISYLSKQKEAEARKENTSFTKKFVNLNNFIQNQYGTYQRRKIKTEMQSEAKSIVNKARSGVSKAISEKRVNDNQKIDSIRRKHVSHKQLVIKNQKSSEESKSYLHKQVSLQKEKRKQQKSNVRQIRVTFAEECFPIVNRRSTQN